MLDACRAEVDSLHAFIEDWLTGRVAKDEASFAPMRAALAEDFTILHACGARSSAEETCERFHAAHGVGGAALRVVIRHREARRLADELALVVYEEWHLGPETNGRLSSAIFRSGPEGPRWLHLHESSLDASGEPG